MFGNWELMIIIFVFEFLSLLLGFAILLQLSKIRLPKKIDAWIERHDGKVLLLLTLGYNLWKSIFIVNYILEWYF
jgi:hypothetical protein